MINVYNRSNSMNNSQGAERAFRKWFLFLLIIAVIGVVVYWIMVSRGKEFEVKVIEKKGNVEYRENDKDGWKEIPSVPFGILPSYEIRTFESSEATLSIEDGSEVRLGEFGRLVLIANQGKIDFVQTDGSSHHQVAKNNDRKEYKVSFGDGDVYAQGTAFELKIKENETDIFALSDNLRLVYKDKSVASLKTGEKLIITPVGKVTNALEESDLKDEWTLNNLKEDQIKKLPIDQSILNKAGIEETQNISSESVSNANSNENNNGNDNGQDNSNLNTNSSNNNSITSQINVKEPASNNNQNNSNSNSNSSGLIQDQNQPTETAETSTASNPSQPSPVKTGTTSRNKCENSGGHWNTSNSVCTCSSSRVFSGGKCVTSSSATSANSNNGGKDLVNTLVLRGNLSGKKAGLSWVSNGGKAPYGYKVMNVSDGGSSKSSKKSATWSNLQSGKTYKFQVCVLNASGGCASYSNVKSVRVP